MLRGTPDPHQQQPGGRQGDERRDDRDHDADRDAAEGHRGEHPAQRRAERTDVGQTREQLPALGTQPHPGAAGAADAARRHRERGEDPARGHDDERPER